MKGDAGGSLYRRPESRHLWMKWYDASGKPHRASSGTDDVRAAKLELSKRIAAVAKGEPVITRRVRVDDLLTDVENDYRNNDRRLDAITEALKRLRAFFGRAYAADVTTDRVRAYIAKHRRTATNPDGLANGTLNRDLSVLRRGYSLALQSTPPKVAVKPYIEMLKEAPPRAGFFERELYEAVRKQLSPDLQVACAIAYAFGWRVPSEVLTLELRHVDLAAGCIRLDPGSTKNDDARVVYLTPELTAGLAEQIARVTALARQTGRVIPSLFPHFTDGPLYPAHLKDGSPHPKAGLRRYLRGDRRRDFVRAWRTACRKAGCSGMRKHDFRRTAVRDMVNDGTPEKVAMLITGHKTRAVFDRYHIVAPDDLKAAAERMAARDGHGAHSGATVTPLPTQLRAQRAR